ncbi:MAG: ferritin-like domain-containing protein [Proteobacteria bacterium]|nr:ferritin-like domain-containing protein [Pseudomonadota bacterium]
MIVFKSEQDRVKLLETLQQNMNEEFRATLQYICHRILAKEANPVLAESFKSAALDEMSHILFFSDLITKYGGTSGLVEWKVDKSADIKEMLERDVELEQEAEKRYASQLNRFAGYAEFCSIIQSVLADEEGHEEEFNRYLREAS